MTEKRFTMDNESDIFEFDWENNEYIDDFMWGDGKSWDRVCNRLNELYEENEQLKKDICNHIQMRLNACQNGGVKQFVDEEFVLQQGRGYSLALFDVKKSLMEDGLWSISVGDWYGRVNTDGD